MTGLYSIRIRYIRLDNGEMTPDFINELYRWALECKSLKIILNSTK